jgi:hypothetical protein
MFLNSKYLRASSLLVIGALSFGCGDDDGDDKPAGNGGTPDGGVDSGIGNGNGDSGTSTPSTGETATYNATLVSILAVDTTMKIPTSHNIELLDNETGAPFSPPIKTTSAQDTGVISVQAPKKPFMVKVTGVGSGPMSTYDAVIVNNYPVLDPLVRISSSGTLTLAEGSGRFTSKPDRAALGATIYWAPGGVRKGTIGCAKVQLDGETTPNVDQDQRYNGTTGLPGPITCAAGTEATCTPITQTLTSGRFYIANITKGKHSVKVTMDGTTIIGEESFVVPYVRTDASSETKAVIVQLGVDIDTPTNPTPPPSK